MKQAWTGKGTSNKPLSGSKPNNVSFGVKNPTPKKGGTAPGKTTFSAKSQLSVRPKSPGSTK